MILLRKATAERHEIAAAARLKLPVSATAQK